MFRVLPLWPLMRRQPRTPISDVTIATENHPKTCTECGAESKYRFKCCDGRFCNSSCFKVHQDKGCAGSASAKPIVGRSTSEAAECVYGFDDKADSGPNLTDAEKVLLGMHYNLVLPRQT